MIMNSHASKLKNRQLRGESSVKMRRSGMKARGTDECMRMSSHFTSKEKQAHNNKEEKENNKKGVG